MEDQYWRSLQRCRDQTISVRLENMLSDMCLRSSRLRLRLHGAIYRPDSFVLMLRYCVNLKAIRYKLTSSNRIVTDTSNRVIVALYGDQALK